MVAQFLFPGQGSQYSGMGLKILKDFPDVKNYYDIAKDILEYDILNIIQDEKLNQTLYTQPAIFIDSIIKDKLLKKNNT